MIVKNAASYLYLDLINKLSGIDPGNQYFTKFTKLFSCILEFKN